MYIESGTIDLSGQEPTAAKRHLEIRLANGDTHLITKELEEIASKLTATEFDLLQSVLSHPLIRLGALKIIDKNLQRAASEARR